MSNSTGEAKRGHTRQDTALMHGLSTTEVQKVWEACDEAKSRAYCAALPQSLGRISYRCVNESTGPYSNFRVGCSVLLTNGDIVQGANVENAAYPVGTCAERVALGTAVVQVGT